MPQEIRVVQCIQCEMFQVDIVKKSNKWQCKVCNAKQRLRKEVFRGTGVDCRKKVQLLNKEKSERIEKKAYAILDLLADEDENSFLLEAATQIDENITKETNIGCFDQQGSVEKLPSKYALKNENKPTNATCTNLQETKKRNLSPEQNEVKNKSSKWDVFL